MKNKIKTFQLFSFKISLIEKGCKWCLFINTKSLSTIPEKEGIKADNSVWGWWFVSIPISSAKCCAEMIWRIFGDIFTDDSLFNWYLIDILFFFSFNFYVIKYNIMWLELVIFR